MKLVCWGSIILKGLFCGQREYKTRDQTDMTFLVKETRLNRSFWNLIFENKKLKKKFK